MSLPSTRQPKILFRFGWHTAPETAHPSPPPLNGPTDGGRWDSPNGSYALVYVASSAHVAVAEVLASFAGPSTANELRLAELAALSDADSAPSLAGLGTRDTIAGDLALRRLVSFAPVGDVACIDTAAGDVLQRIQQKHPEAAVAMMGPGAPLTAERLRLQPDRRVTRPMGATLIHDMVQLQDACAGVRYASRFTGDESCWALEAALAPEEEGAGSTCAHLDLHDGARELGLDDPLVERAFELIADAPGAAARGVADWDVG